MRARTLLATSLIGLSGFLSTAAHSAPLPDFAHVLGTHPATYALLLDRHGQPLQALPLIPGVERASWTPLAQLPPTVMHALLISEDQRFFLHHGVDWQAVLGAAWENLWYNTHRGASTLTMQLSGLLDPTLMRTHGGRSYQQKWLQIRAAERLEKHWSKAQILEAYLNLATFRGDLVGIGAATQALFGVAPDSLDDAQADILAALLRGPNAHAKIVAHRACELAELIHNPSGTCKKIQLLSERHLTASTRLYPDLTLADDAARQLLHTAGEQLTSSLDRSIQLQTLASLYLIMQNTDAYRDASILVLNQRSGEILAYADQYANQDSSNAPHSDPLLTIRSFDHAALPLLYQLALTQHTVQADELLNDASLAFNTQPVNDAVSADAQRINLPMAITTDNYPAAWRVMSDLPTLSFGTQLQTFNLSLESSNQPEPVQGSLLALANAWQTLANHGVFMQVSFHPGGLNTPFSVMDDNSVSVISQLLSDPSNHLNDVAPHANAAWLSGQDSCTAWRIGYDAQYTVLLWLDKRPDKQQCSPNTHTNNPATPVWNKLLNGLTQHTTTNIDPNLDPVLQHLPTAIDESPTSIPIQNYP